MHIASLVKIPCYFLKLQSGNENMGVSPADNSVKIWRNLPISNPKPDLHNINAHTKFGENPLKYWLAHPYHIYPQVTPQPERFTDHL